MILLRRCQPAALREGVNFRGYSMFLFAPDCIFSGRAIGQRLSVVGFKLGEMISEVGEFVLEVGENGTEVGDSSRG